jgi:hypothetical protein
MQLLFLETDAGGMKGIPACNWSIVFEWIVFMCIRKFLSAPMEFDVT